MAPNLASGNFRIVSLADGHLTTSIDHSKPGHQSVRLSMHIKNWILKKHGDTFLLSIGGYPYTGVVDEKVTASTNPEHEREWHATYREFEDAYTIELADDNGKAWTVPVEFSTNPEIEIKPIMTRLSERPRYFIDQLFRFVPVSE